MSKPPHNQRGPQHPQQQAQQQQVRQVAVQQWSGPLPAPADLEKFNQIIPNGAERILAMSEKEQAHRISYESTGLTATIEESRRGQYLGSLISAAAIGGAIYTAAIGAHWAIPVSLVGVPILGIVRAIVGPRRK
ncbi:MAG: DUF2335 domain-containing protein [Betaproteobacteria bacterium]|nr:DUF2335 domain-containing protein [Betaproteobacteria bacterium]